jgi:hypothetical protein
LLPFTSHSIVQTARSSPEHVLLVPANALELGLVSAAAAKSYRGV